MGVLASVLGLFAGLGVAAGVNQVFQSAGFDIPRSGLVLQPRTIVIALSVGIIVTVLSAVIPATRATRVPPMAALQEGAVLPPSRFARFMPALAVVVAILGGLLIAGGMYGPGGTLIRLGTIAFGAVLVFVAVAIASRYFVGPLAAGLGWPLQKLSPISGRLARDNSRRNPSRTALTAAALMIGLAVVVFVAVLAQGLKSSFIDSYDRVVRADFVVASKNFMTIPNDTAAKVQAVQGVATAVSLDAQQVQAENGSLPVVWGIDPSAIERVWSFDWIEGGDEVLAQLGTDGAIVEEQTAASLGDVKAGDTIAVTTVEGKQASLKILGVYRDPMMLNGIVVSSSGYDALFPTPQTFMVVAKAQPGADLAATQKAIEAALESDSHGGGADRRAVQGGDRRPGQPAAPADLRPARAQRHHLVVRHRQHAGAGGVRAHARDRPGARHRHVARAGARDGALRERHHLDHRRDPRHRGRHRVRLGGRDALRGAGDHLLDPGHAAGRAPRARRGRRRDRRHPAGAAGGEDRHPAGDPLRVRGRARRRSGARPPGERRRPVLGYHLRAPAAASGGIAIQLLDDQHWHALPEREVTDLLETDREEGLDRFAVEHRRTQFGLNELTPPKGPGPLRRFAMQFTDPLVLILLVSAIVTIFLDEWVDAIVIFGVVLLNAIVGYLQEAKAVAAIDALSRAMTAEATVIRAGDQLRLPATEIVPGDLVLVQAGDKVPADLRLFRTRDLRVDESALTGESVPVEKDDAVVPRDAVLADRVDMAYRLDAGHVRHRRRPRRRAPATAPRSARSASSSSRRTTSRRR